MATDETNIRYIMEDVEMINLDSLNELTDGDSTLLGSLLDEFLNTTETDLQSLKEGVEKGYSDKVASLSHRIKGSSMIVGAEKLTRLTQDLETAGQQANTDVFSPLLSEIEEVYSQVVEAINTTRQ
ncbi:hypothetical protein EOPP23_04090 [Endozoicomonas sp. OPT23]|uniref:Hpt domain-containing protein n=1 Tax=Endozoicomonas sp. OPT23 TaxID=2072845 RepID=UPI00129BDF34|nr:Hpt domain-containing protein [Endozoicomonas sp. OPT23]MRI32176.1 hypothetical protein [Endozoicomonas sp. OPT23]